jgi:hypothetical protein
LTRARNRRITHRGARSTFAGGRVKSGDLDPASPVRQSSIPRSGSFTEARRIYFEGWTGLGMALLAGLRWRGIGRGLVRSRARGGVRLKLRLALYARVRAGDTGVAWRGAGHAGSGAGRALARLGRVEHVEVFFCPCSTAHRDRRRANLGKNPAQASSWHLWLSLVCEFQGKISPRSDDFWTPNLACPTIHSTTKVMPNQVKRIWLDFKLFQWVP